MPKYSDGNEARIGDVVRHAVNGETYGVVTHVNTDDDFGIVAGTEMLFDGFFCESLALVRRFMAADG